MDGFPGVMPSEVAPVTGGQCGAPRRSSREGKGAGGLRGFGVNVPKGRAVGAASHSCGRGWGTGEGWAARTPDGSGGVQARFSGVTCCLLVSVVERAPRRLRRVDLGQGREPQEQAFPGGGAKMGCP